MNIINFKRRLLRWHLFRLLRSLKRIVLPMQVNGLNNRVICKCKTSKRFDFHISISGDNNIVEIAPTVQLYNTSIRIVGDNNILILDDEVKIQKGSINISGGANLIMRHNTTFQEVSIFLEKEKCDIGVDCLGSYGVIIRNYDGHKIIDTINNQICNPPKPIVINNHVWISQNVTILGGARIGENSIIGTGAIVTSPIPSACVAAGIPAKFIKGNRSWIRH